MVFIVSRKIPTTLELIQYLCDNESPVTRNVLAVSGYQHVCNAVNCGFYPRLSVSLEGV